MFVDIHDSDGYSWTMARRPPHVGLGHHVRSYTGYVERSTLPLCRREVAHGGVVLIISFGDRIDVRLSSDGTAGRHRSFVAGLHDGWAITEQGGRQHGVEVELTPLGAYRLLGVPPDLLANQVVALGALDLPSLTELEERLASAPDWNRRFDLLDRALLQLADDGPEPDPAVDWAWRQLRATHGRVAVGELAGEIGWSRRHFAARFRHQIGLPPKAVARVIRFDHAVDLLTDDDRMSSISDVAATCGYTDHSHLVRDFHDLAGCTPTALLAARLPDGGGIAG